MNIFKQRLTAALEAWDGGHETSAKLADALVDAVKPKPNPTPWYVELGPSNYGPATGAQKIYIKDANRTWVATATRLDTAQQIVETINKADNLNWTWPGYVGKS
jgi:hypothetical protein